jgi:hypothetical protein
MMAADNAFAITVDTNRFASTTNTFDFTNVVAGDYITAHTSSAGQVVWTNLPAFNGFVHTGATSAVWLELDFSPSNPTNTYIVLTSATNFTVSATNIHLMKNPREFSLVFPTNSASYALWFTNLNGITHKWMSATNATKTNTYHREVIVYASRTNEASVYQADNR